MRIKNFFISFTLAVLTFIFVASCRSSNTDSQGASTSPASSNLKVAMILTGSRQDASWSQAGYEGLKLIEQKFGAKVAYTENVSAASSEKLLHQYAQQGYNLIIGNGGTYIAAAEKVAQEFPRTKFALVSTYPGNNKNLGAVAFRSGEAGYLTGLLAASKTKTNKVGYIVGYDYPVYKEEAALFKRGAKATKPSVEVSTEFIQTWTDTKKATKVALDLVKSGVDVLAINADEAGIAALKEVTQKQGVYAIGWTKDQHELAPGHVLTSVLQDVPSLVLNAAVLMQQGRWEGKLYKFGLKEKIYDFASFRGTLTPQEEASFENARNQIVAGKIDVSP